jgi:glycosyltransferase involved in cell wall biosynthesis
MWRDASRSEVPVDLVHGTAFPYSFPLACGLRLARKAQVPFFLTPFLHLGDPTNPRDRTRRQYTAPHLRYLLRHADRVFVQTPSEFAAVEQLGVPSANIVLQGLGVDPEECTGGVAERFRDEWAIPESHCVIGHLANLSEEKGSVDLLQALRELSDIPLTLVLAGPAMPNFLRAWGSCSEKHRVVRTGPLTAEQKKDFFAGIDLFSLPSRSDSFGLVLLEAWANQKPVIAYRAGGPCDLVRQGADGLLVPCGDVVRLAEQIRTLARDPAMRQQLGQAGEVRCRTHFTWARTFQVWDDVLQDYGLIRTS